MPPPLPYKSECPNSKQQFITLYWAQQIIFGNFWNISHIAPNDKQTYFWIFGWLSFPLFLPIAIYLYLLLSISLNLSLTHTKHKKTHAHFLGLSYASHFRIFGSETSL